MERRSFLISIGLHISVVVLAWIGLPNLKRDLPEEQPLVVMEMVKSVPETNLSVGDKPSTAKKEQKPTKVKTPPPPPPPPRPKPPAPKPPQSVEKAPDQKAEVLPEKIVKTPKSKPAVAQPAVPPKPKPKQKAQRKAPTKLPKSPPQRINKMAQKKAKQKQQKQALSGVMQNLAKAKIAAQEAEKARREEQRKQAAENLTNNLTAAAGQAVRAPKKARDAPMGLDDIDRIRQHVSGCWSPPIGTAGADTLIVDIIVTLDRDGRVLTAEVENKLRLGFDATFKVAADEAIRTMSKCSPLPVPPGKYEQWKSFIFRFDPKFLTR